MAPTLPEDILYLICAQLQELKDFHTLFCCALASKRFAEPALSSLYRNQNVAPVTGGGSDDAPSRVGQDATVAWMSMWRTLILSCIGQTAYPYCRYIRVLDLNDLQQLLEDQRFQTHYSTQFFAGSMERFLREYDTPGGGNTGATTRSNKRTRRFNTSATLAMVAEALTEQTPMVQELAGSLDSEHLTKWLPRLRHLQRLRLWDGWNVDGIAPVLCENCHNFRALMFYQARHEQSDQVLAKFLSELKPNTFQSFEVAGSLTAENAIFSAFNHHASSLTDLKLEDLPGNAMLNLAQMSSCTSLETLHIKLQTTFDKVPANEEFIKNIVTWLRSCRKLIDVSFDSRKDSKDLFIKVLTPLLLDNDVHLRKLSVSNYSSSQAADFHQALASQGDSLEDLYLKAEGESVDALALVDSLVNSLKNLHNLVYLRLQSLSDYFQDRHIIQIAENMPYLEDLWISGWGITDLIWPSISKLKNLRRLEINAVSNFSFDGVLAFVNQLDPDEKGFFLGIMMADPSSQLAQNEEEQALIREVIESKTEGRFEFTLARDPDAVEYDSSSDSE